MCSSVYPKFSSRCIDYFIIQMQADPSSISSVPLEEQLPREMSKQEENQQHSLRDTK